MIYKSIRKTILQLLVVLFTLVHCANFAVLSVFEQKKYKKYSDGNGLYSLKDDVEILTADNFKNEVYNNERALFVEFYNSWCGFCQRFAPSWKALATDVKAWKDILGIAAIDCADAANNPTCRNFEIMGYPTLKYFHERYQEGPKELGLQVQAAGDANGHRGKLLEVLMNEQWEGRGKIFPNLLPYTDKNERSLFESVPLQVKYVILVIQKPSDYLGQELAMDLHKVKDISIRYAYDNNTELVNNMKAKEFPKLYVIDRDYNVRSLSPSSLSRDSCRTAIREFLEPKHIVLSENSDKRLFTGRWRDVEVPDMETYLHKKEQEVLKDRIKKIGDAVFQMDLETALRYSLKYEIVSYKEISGERLDALKSYLEVLARHFPFGKFGQMFLMELKEYVATKKSVRGEDLGVLVKEAEKEERMVFSSPERWLACRGSTPKHRGYPCGVWKMFHYLTVNAAENGARTSSDPKSVLLAMHGYIKYFFGCSDCSRHFQEMAKRKGLNDVQSWEESVIWLWSAHNEVNSRLAGDETEDPEFPKVQFPAKEHCPRCHLPNDSWNLTEVYQYLRHMYSSINVRYIGSDTRILHLGLNGTEKADYEFKMIDTSMCFILYIVCFTFIILLINVVWRRRRYRKKMYVHDVLGKV